MITHITMPVAEHLYDATFHHTSILDYGYTLEDFANGRPIPPQGAQFDIGFEGVVEGPRLRGTLVGVDYGVLRADGRFDLNLHATITTHDGEKIALSATGIFRPADGAVRENVTLTTASPRYAWVNQLQIWVRGIADIQKREIKLEAYIA